MVPGRPITSERSANPLRLKQVLIDHDIQYADLRQQLLRTTGRMTGEPISNADMSFLLNRGWMPAQMREAEVRAATERYLRGRGVTDDEIEGIWFRNDQTPPKPRHRLDLPDRPPTQRTLRAAAAAANDEPDLDLPEHEMLTATARRHFNLFRHPFQDDIQSPDDVFMSADHRYIRDSMFYAARQGGFIAVIGESGSGKSTLRRDQEDRIRRDNEPIVLINPRTIDKTALTSRHICDAIIADVSNETPKATLEAKARQIQRLLSSGARAGNTYALIIEEAHDLSIATLKYLKRFWEMEDGFKRLLGIILIGQPELGERLDERKNPDAREVIRRCEVARLPPLDANLEKYLQLKFKRVGTDLDALFDPGVCDAIRERLTLRRRGDSSVESHVYPLVVANLVTRVLNQAAELGFKRVTPDLVRGV